MTDVVDELRKQAWRRGRAAEEARRARGRRGQGGQGSRYAAQEPRGPHRGPGRSLERSGQGGQARRAYLLRSACATCSKPAAARRRGSGWSRGSPAPAAPGSTRSRSSQEVRRHKDAIVRAVGSASQRQGRGHQQQDQAHGEDGLGFQELRQPRGAGHAQVLEPPDRASRALDPTHRNPRSLLKNEHMGLR